MEKDLTEGSILKSLVFFSLPMIAGNILQQLYNISDTLIVGNTIGRDALVAVGSSYTIMVLLTSIIMGLCTGSGVVFSKFFGAKKIDLMKNSIFNAFIFICIISILINIISFIMLDKILIWVNIPKSSFKDTKTYLFIIFCGMSFVTIYNFFSSVLRSVGNTVIPLVFLAISAITNIILDIFL